MPASCLSALTERRRSRGRQGLQHLCAWCRTEPPLAPVVYQGSAVGSFCRCGRAAGRRGLPWRGSCRQGRRQARRRGQTPRILCDGRRAGHAAHLAVSRRSSALPYAKLHSILLFTHHLSCAACL
jgi:hypothetical protein